MEDGFKSQIKLNTHSIVKLSFKNIKRCFTADYFILNFFQGIERKKI